MHKLTHIFIDENNDALVKQRTKGIYEKKELLESLQTGSQCTLITHLMKSTTLLHHFHVYYCMFPFLKQQQQQQQQQKSKIWRRNWMKSTMSEQNKWVLSLMNV